MLAKQVTTLDTISGGRAILGHRRRLERGRARGLRLRVPADPRADGSPRGGAHDHQGDVHRGSAVASQGSYYRIEQALNVPRPVQPGGPKILVGGGGEQRTLRIAAKYADMTHWFALGLDALKHKTEVLERYCEEIGRDPSTIERTMRRAGDRHRDGGGRRRRSLETDPAERRPFVKRRDARPGRPRGSGRTSRRVHGLHVQQQPLPDARADRAASASCLQLVASETPVGAR